METETPAIEQGIRAVAVGKKGSKNCPEEVAAQILEDLQQDKIDPVQKGAFFGALAIKGVEPSEQRIADAVSLANPEAFLDCVASDTPVEMRPLCQKLLEGKELNLSEAQQVGEFFFSDQPGDAARSLMATILRVRYANAEEYAGIYFAMRESFAKPFQEPVPSGGNVALLSEPFDGVERSYLLTPLIAAWLGQQGYRVVSAVGESSGPKYGVTLMALANALDGSFLESNAELTGNGPAYGWYVDQAKLSPAVHRWVGIRKKLLKRPGLATLERFVNPAAADLFINSTFHPPFAEKSVEIAQQLGFRAVIVLCKGTEGTLGCALKRRATVYCAVLAADGQWSRTHFALSAGDFGVDTPDEPELEVVDVSKNASLIEAYAKEGTSGDAHFDGRAEYTLKVMANALNWIDEHSGR
jgi:anthranilate phosphoribosyltransferase